MSWNDRHDPEGDGTAAQERADRIAERGDSPELHLDLTPTATCSECGYLAREIRPGHWICPCDDWSGVV